MYSVIINSRQDWLSIGRMFALLNKMISESFARKATLEQRFILCQRKSYASIRGKTSLAIEVRKNGMCMAQTLRNLFII